MQNPFLGVWFTAIMGATISFEAWKQLLMNDCIACGKEREYNALSDYVLKVLFASGLEPTVSAISHDGVNVNKSIA